MRRIRIVLEARGRRVFGDELIDGETDRLDAALRPVGPCVGADAVDQVAGIVQRRLLVGEVDRRDPKCGERVELPGIRRAVAVRIASSCPTAHSCSAPELHDGRKTG